MANKNALRASIALAAIIAAMPLSAKAAEVDPAPDSGQSAKPNADRSAALDEIIVTATKRSVDLQKTPAAITAISGTELSSRGVSDIRGAQNLVPSVRFQAEAASTQIYLRGVGGDLDEPQLDSPASLNFNGIYIPREASVVPFFDMSGIEVLLGPQGTLYGRGALGGIVNASYARPSQTTEGSALIEAGNYALVHTSAMANIAVSDRFAIRGAVDYAKRDGYQKSGADSADDIAGRLSANFKATDSLNIYVWGQYSNRAGIPANVVTLGVNPATGGALPGTFLNADPWNDTRTAAVLALPSNPFLPAPQSATAQPSSGEVYITGAEFKLTLGSMTLTYIPSYLNSRSDVRPFLGAYTSEKFDKSNQWTQELRLSGGLGKIDYIIGLYAYRLSSAGFFNFSVFPSIEVNENRLKGEAAFGELTYRISDKFRIIAGGRFSADSRRGDGVYTGFQGSNFLFNAPYTFSRKYHHADYKLSIQFDMNKNTMTYASVQSGYQPGTFNALPSIPTASNAVDPASITAVTVGQKTRFFDGKLQINDELFYYSYSNLFESSYNNLLNITQIFNAKKVEIYGNQFDLLYKPTPSDLFSLNIGYLHARNKKFTLPDGSANFDGLQLQSAPDLTLNAGYHHDFLLTQGYVRAAVNTRFESVFYGDFSHNPGSKQSSYTKTDASLTYYADGGR